jgi:hypothetical protein
MGFEFGGWEKALVALLQLSDFVTFQLVNSYNMLSHGIETTFD